MDQSEAAILAEQELSTNQKPPLTENVFVLTGKVEVEVPWGVVARGVARAVGVDLQSNSIRPQ